MSEPYRVSMTGKPVRHLRPLQNVRRLVLTGLMLACLAAQPLLAWEHWGGNAVERASRHLLRSRLRM